MSGLPSAVRNSPYLASPGLVSVDRGIAELRSGRPVVIESDPPICVLPTDGLTDIELERFRAFCRPSKPHLVLSLPRANWVGVRPGGPIGLVLSARDNAEAIRALASDAEVRLAHSIVDPGVGADFAIELAKLAQSLPALLIAEISGADAARLAPLVRVVPEAITEFRRAANESLTIVARANVPLDGGVAAEFVVFRDSLGGGATAVIVGKPDVRQPVAIRLHSACLTGDVFGSRRCDCGDQLRLSLRRLEDEGGGVVLYLDQEGRGLGLANKMRTYQLQDDGLDTLDANTALGFDDDERDYGIAVRMLQLLGCDRVRVLTNNPAKLDGLTPGVQVCGRIPLHGPVNADNFRYLSAKANRAGHKLEYLMAEVAEPGPPS